MIAVIVQGLFEKSDSIGYDAVHQFKTLRELCGDARPVRLFAERFDLDLHKDIPIESVDLLLSTYREFDDLLIVYHFCDGWPLIDGFLIGNPVRAVVRWHNNTPPWFYTQVSRRSANRSAQGFQRIAELSANEGVSFWVNSEFTATQFRVLTGKSGRCHVVYPASRYLEPASPSTVEPPVVTGDAGEPIRILFVGRLVAHKGHKHVVALAALLQRYCRREVLVDFPGREDSSAWQFNNFLRDLASENEVTVNFLGEVDEAHLRSLYDRCSVFVCLSEHEGFGMPPFEAIRCQVPVVAWANTALRELLRDHPLGFEDFDLKSFAAAIVALENAKFRSEILAVQNKIAASYSTQVVRDQITAALDVGGSDRASPDLRRSVAEEAVAIDLAPLNEALEALRAFPFELTRNLEHDYTCNFVTAYDVSSYITLLDDGLRNAAAALQAEVAPSVAVTEMRIEATEFSTHRGRFKEGTIEFLGGKHPEGQFVFGPYIKLPTGEFEVSFHLERLENLNPDGVLLFDIYVDGVGVVARRSVFPSLLRSGIVHLDFVNASVSDVIEFRLGPDPSFEGSFRFAGLSIRRLASIDLLPSGFPIVQISKLPSRLGGGRSFSTPRLLRLITHAGRRAIGNAISDEKKATELFDMADRARDVGSWSEAAELYRRGLEICPNVVRYVVQMAHAYKESGQLAPAELAYLGALELDPFDRDLKLQLGHFYSLTGRKPLAERFYIEAIRGDTAALDAYDSLRRFGISSEVIRAASQNLA